MSRKNFLNFIFTLIFFFLNISAVNAVDFALKIGESSLSQNEVHIPVTAEKTSDYNFLKPFKLELDYNHDIFDFKEFVCNSPFSKNDFSANNNPSLLTILSNFKKIININFQNRIFYLGDIVLSIKDNSASGEQTFDCSFVQNEFYNETIKSSSSVTLTPSQTSFSSKSSSSRPKTYLNPKIIQNQKNKSSGKLKSITPNVGTLSPSFDPNIFEYSIDVDENVQYVEIDAVPQENDSTVKISRRKLLAAGKTTIIKIIVSNKGGKTIYIVKVNRGIDSNNNNNNNNSKNSKKEKSSGRKRGRKKSKKDKFGNDIYDDDDDDDDEEENDNDENTNENQVTKNENNSQIYLIVILSLVVLAIIGYYTYKFIKYKRNNSKNIKNPLNKPSK